MTGSTHGWRKWVAIILLSFLVVSFVFFGLSYYMQSILSGSKNIATVAGQPISRADFQQALQIQQQQMPRVDDSLLPLIKQRVLTQMIIRLVMLHEANYQGFQVSDKQLRDMVHAMPLFQDAGNFSRAKFSQVAAANGMSDQALLDKLRDNLVVYQMQNSFLATSFVVPAIIKERYKLLYQKRDIAYLLVDPKKYLASMRPNADSVTSYYKSNTQRFVQPDSVKLQYVVLNPADISKQIVISPLEMRQYYADNKQQLLSAPRWRVRKIIVTGADAAKHSQDLLQQFNKQSVSWTAIAAQKNVSVSQAWLGSSTSQDWLSAVAQLKPNQFSKVIQSGKSYVILQLLNYSAPQAQTYSAAKSRIENTLRSQKVASKMAQLNESLSNLAYSSASSLQPIVKQLGLKLQTSSWVTKDEASGLFANKQLLTAAFSSDVFQHKNNSAPIVLSDGRVVVLRALQSKPAHVLPLAQVRAKVVAALQQEMAQQKAAQQVSELVTKLQAGSGISVLAKQQKLQYKQINGVDAEMQHLPPRLVSSAFAISGIGKDTITSTQLADGDYAVLQVLKVRTPDAEDMTASKLRQVTQTITQLQSERELQLFMLEAKARAKVKLYKK